MTNNFKILVATSTIFVAGCISNPNKTLIDRGQYLTAYREATTMNVGRSRKDAAEDIISKTGGKKSDIFYKHFSDSIENEPKTTRHFYINHQLATWALEDELISDAQKKQILEKLTEQLTKESVSNPSLLNEPLITKLYNISADARLQSANADWKKIATSNNATVSSLLPLHAALKQQNQPTVVSEIEQKMHQLAIYELAERIKHPHDYSSLSPYIQYIEQTGRSDIKPLLEQALKKVNLTKKDLDPSNSTLARVLPIFAQTETKNREIKVNLLGPSNINFRELLAEIKRQNEWITISTDSTKNLRINEIDIRETQSTPISATEIVTYFPNNTQFFIPKGASVMFDYTTTEYQVQWQTTIEDLSQKTTEPHFNRINTKRIECTNMRYRNVFGGVGAIQEYPNSKTEAFCTENSKTTLERTRAMAIKDIAQLILAKIGQ